MNKSAFFGIIILCLVSQILAGQVVIRPNVGNSPTFSLSQAIDIRITNVSTGPVYGFVQVQIKDHIAKSSYRIQSLPLTLKVGGILTSEDIQWSEGLDIASLVYANTLVEQGIPSGRYEFCYRFIQNESGKSLGIHCQVNPLIKFQRTQLIYPRDGQDVNTLFPILSWRPPMSIDPSDLRYRVTVVELMEGQVPLDGINTNLPIHQEEGLRSPMLNYPAGGIPIKEDEQYAWQVEAMINNTGIGISEVFSFGVGPTDEAELEEELEAYRGVKKVLDGSQYVFSKEIYLAYDNRTYENDLNYKVWEKGRRYAARNKAKLPAVSIKSGINNLMIEAKALRLKNGRSYILEITDAKGSKRYLEFKKSK